jgi:hypothetical protein
LLQRL